MLGGGLLSFLSAAQNSGVFLGVNAGVPITTPTYGGGLAVIKQALPSNGIGYAVGVDLGYKQALSKNMGLKYYLEYNYSKSKGKKEGSSIQLINKVDANITADLLTLNIDYYFNPVDLFGIYVGIGVGYQSFKPTWDYVGMGNTTGSVGGKTKGGLAVPLNVGVTFNISDGNQILLGAKIPLVAYDYKTEIPAVFSGGAATSMAPANVKLKNYIVQVGYNYTF